jgi:hypothetical protein
VDGIEALGADVHLVPLADQFCCGFIAAETPLCACWFAVGCRKRVEFGSGENICELVEVFILVG